LDLLGPNLEDFKIDGRMQRYRYLVAASHHLTLALAKRFHRMVPIIYVMGYPRSGTTWLCRLIADYLHLPHPQVWVTPFGGPAVTHTHDLASHKLPYSVYAVRDGRDAMVSFYYMYVRGMPDRPTRAYRNAPWFPPETRNNTRQHLPAFIEHIMTRPHPRPYNWPTHVQRSLDRGPANMPLVHYESLHADPETTLATMLEVLCGQAPDPEQVRHTVDRNSFQRLSGRTSGQADTGALMRKGVVGDWRNHFTREAAEVFDHYAGEVLIRLGYENNRQWISECCADAAGDQTPAPSEAGAST
jgi:hypothetical protein